MPETVVEGQAETGMCVDDSWVFTIPGEQNAPNVRRTEIYLTTDGRQVVGGEGSLVEHEADLVVHLGPAGAADTDWHVVWQLHGPTDGEWRPPPVSLVVRHGELSLQGGAGWPGQNYATADHEWTRPLTPIQDGHRHRVKLRVMLSSDPKKAWIDAGVDGRQVLTRWHPVSKDGFSVGTIYPGQPQVASRIGLYRGSQGSKPPTYTQIVREHVLVASVR